MAKSYLILAILFVSLTLAGSLCAGDLEKFLFNPEKTSVGTLYQYVKTNQDGSEPMENIAIYVAAPDRLEVFKYRDPGTRAALVIAWFDWSIFSVRRLESHQVLSPSESTLIATMDYDPQASTATTRVLVADIPPETIQIPQLPFHIYNFDFTSLNFSMRHLRDPLQSFTFDVADLVSRDGEWHFVNRGLATVAYIARDTVHDRPCLKYSINGDGLENRGGFLWVNAEGGHVEKIQIDLPDNPDWQSFLFELKETRKVSADQWKEFRDAHFQK